MASPVRGAAALYLTLRIMADSGHLWSWLLTVRLPQDMVPCHTCPLAAIVAHMITLLAHMITLLAHMITLLAHMTTLLAPGWIQGR
jgi:hypothetical protein